MRTVLKKRLCAIYGRITSEFSSIACTVNSSERTCPRNSEPAAHAPGPWRLSPSSVGRFCRALGDSLGPPALGSSPRTARWRSTVASFRESLCLAAQSAGPPRAAGTTVSRYQGALLVAVRDPLQSLPISERGQRARVTTFPTRVAVPEEGVGASRSAEDRRERFWCLVRNTMFSKLLVI